MINPGSTKDLQRMILNHMLRAETGMLSQLQKEMDMPSISTLHIA